MSNVRLAIVLFLIFPTALFVISLRWILEERRVRNQLKHSGETLEANIVKAGQESFGRSYRLYVTYRFSTKVATGQPRYFSRTQSISDRHLRSLQKRSTVTVSYLPSDPMISRLSGSDTDNVRRLSAQVYLFLALCVWGAALFLWGLIG